MPDILEFVRARSLTSLCLLELLSTLLEVLEPDKTDGALLEGIFHGVILAHEAVRRRSRLLRLLDECLLLPFELLTHLSALLDKSFLTTAFRLVVRHDDKRSPELAMVALGGGETQVGAPVNISGGMGASSAFLSSSAATDTLSRKTSATPGLGHIVRHARPRCPPPGKPAC